MKGWVKIHRKIKKSVFYGKPDYMAIWFHLLLTAAHEEIKIAIGNQVITLQPGQICTGRKALAAATGVTEMKCFRILKCLENEQQIEQQTFTKFSIISIVNWDEYQCNEQQIEQQMNNKRTTDEQQMNTNKKLKNEKNKNTIDLSFTSESGKVYPYLDFFLALWEAYPRKEGSKAALRHYQASVKTIEDMELINRALGNYLHQVEGVERRFIKQGATWFNNWRDYVHG